MSLEPFLRRELITSVRRGTAFSERRGHVVLMTAAVAGTVAVWDRWGWDRASVAGAASFALSMFGLVVAAHAVLVFAAIPGMVAPLIASERDRKSLDSLLATPLSSTEIVLGTMGAGLLRYTNGIAALVPVLTLMVFLGGMDPRLVLLAVAGLASTAFALTALSAVVSAGARTALRATNSTLVLAMTWMFLPALIVLFRALGWRAAPWVVTAALWLHDSTPFGVALNAVGMVSRSSLTGSVLRMIAIQTAAAVVLVVWAIARLRPASRAVDDVGFRRSLRAHWRPRPASGDDPVLWHEIHSARAMSTGSLQVDRLLDVLGVGLLACATSWFAVPAFAELFQTGYGPIAGIPAVTEDGPILRALVGKAVTPGQARLQFNIALRQMTGVLDLLYVLMVAWAASESLLAERERNTWLGLIATPLTDWEILRAKMLGSIWKSRRLALLMLALWMVGLLAGALHPLGFLAALTGMVVSCGFLSALGVSMALWSRDRREADSRVFGPLMLSLGLYPLPFMLPGTASVLMAVGAIPFQTWAALLSYEDVHAAIHSGVPPQYTAIGIQIGVSVRIVLAAWLISTIAQAIGAALLTRSAVCGFDVANGRTMRT